MKIDWRVLFVAIDFSLILLGFLVVFAIHPSIQSVGIGPVIQMTWNEVTMLVLADFFILTIIFYFLLYLRKANKTKI